VIEARVRLTEVTLFASRAGHDMLGPLNQVGSLLTLFVKRYRNKLDSEAELLLDFVMSAVGRMESVTAAMQQYLKLASASPRFEPVELNPLLCAALVPLGQEISQCGAVVTADLPPERLLADKDQMTTVFQILIGNAIRFRRPSEPARVHVKAARMEGSWVIAVADNGMGIEPENHEAVFLPFKRLNGRDYPGAGLGLSTAKLIAGLHQGNIRIESDPASGHGTTVLLTVPDLRR
jgi:light-regulated signal transduction histidine kinase (bacteriophytochrome)